MSELLSRYNFGFAIVSRQVYLLNEVGSPKPGRKIRKMAIAKATLLKTLRQPHHSSYRYEFRQSGEVFEGMRDFKQDRIFSNKLKANHKRVTLRYPLHFACRK
jgi:hypothetical protein